ncbi:MAG: LysR family transcriptional regulator [Gammaproteobacteria bacterium]|nr:LysR family transcriptional regulator [Gammaproteobacteria bacterium]
MKHILPSLDSLKVFESAARHLSFSLAAEELCLSKGAVSYQIKKLGLCNPTSVTLI